MQADRRVLHRPGHGSVRRVLWASCKMGSRDLGKSGISIWKVSFIGRVVGNFLSLIVFSVVGPGVLYESGSPPFFLKKKVDRLFLTEGRDPACTANKNCLHIHHMSVRRVKNSTSERTDRSKILCQKWLLRRNQCHHFIDILQTVKHWHINGIPSKSAHAALQALLESLDSTHHVKSRRSDINWSKAAA